MEVSLYLTLASNSSRLSSAEINILQCNVLQLYCTLQVEVTSLLRINLNVSLLMLQILWHSHYILAVTVCPVGLNYFSSLLCRRMTAVILHFKYLIVQHDPFHFCHVHRTRRCRYWVSSEPAFLYQRNLKWGLKMAWPSATRKREQNSSGI